MKQKACFAVTEKKIIEKARIHQIPKIRNVTCTDVTPVGYPISRSCDFGKASHIYIVLLIPFSIHVCHVLNQISVSSLYRNLLHDKKALSILFHMQVIRRGKLSMRAQAQKSHDSSRLCNNNWAQSNLKIIPNSPSNNYLKE